MQEVVRFPVGPDVKCRSGISTLVVARVFNSAAFGWVFNRAAFGWVFNRVAFVCQLTRMSSTSSIRSS